jgi:hypothetical protein
MSTSLLPDPSLDNSRAEIDVDVVELVESLELFIDRYGPSSRCPDPLHSRGASDSRGRFVVPYFVAMEIPKSSIS